MHISAAFKSNKGEAVSREDFNRISKIFGREARNAFEFKYNSPIYVAGGIKTLPDSKSEFHIENPADDFERLTDKVWNRSSIVIGEITSPSRYAPNISLQNTKDESADTIFVDVDRLSIEQAQALFHAVSDCSRKFSFEILEP